jgi:hypothetical protein
MHNAVNVLIVILRFQNKSSVIASTS